jgi:hypothetical protein
LGSGESCEEEGQKDDAPEEIAAEERCSRAMGRGRAEIWIVALEQGCTSVVGLRCASAPEGFA